MRQNTFGVRALRGGERREERGGREQEGREGNRG